MEQYQALEATIPVSASPASATSSLPTSAFAYTTASATRTLPASKTVFPLPTYSIKPELDPLEREKREIERRRQRFEDRKKRILHAKTRIIGVDVDSLSEQVKDKQEKEKSEYERNLFYDSQRLDHARTIEMLERERALEMKRREEELLFYRQQQQLEKSYKDRVAQAYAQQPQPEDDHSVFLKFAGEDPEYDARTKAQQQQQKEWCTQQLTELQQKELEERLQENDYAATQNHIVELQNENYQQFLAMKRAQAENQALTNKQLSIEKRLREQQQQQQEEAKKQQELEAQLSSDFLNERTREFLPYNFKGFTTGMKQAILQQQQQQMYDKQLQQQKEWEEEQKYQQQQEDILRQRTLMEREKQRSLAQKRMALSQEHQQQQKEQSLKTQYLDKVVYTNEVRDEFFNRFGNSHR